MTPHRAAAPQAAPSALDDLAQHLRGYGTALDEVCAAACRDVLMSGAFADSELREAYSELWRLSEGKDLAYDRPSIGLHYALWYHLQRTHTLTRVLAPLLCDRRDPITIHDIGCGTGATAWAAAIMAAAMRDANRPVPSIRVIGTDTSPFMLDAGRRLWHALCGRLAVDRGLYEADQGDWAAVPPEHRHNDEGLVVGSYLLNSSDDTYLNEIESWLTKATDRLAAGQLLLVSSPGKAHLVDKLAASPDWDRGPQEIELFDVLWSGSPVAVAETRRRLLDRIGEKSPRPPSWQPDSEPTCRLLRRSAEQLPGTAARVLTELNDEQDYVAEPSERLTALVGAAGSGKSFVICERVVRVLEQATAIEPPRILVTSFNKAMVDQLAEWTIARIENSELRLRLKQCGEHGEGSRKLEVTKGDVRATVHFLNRDKLPTRVWMTGHVGNPFTRNGASDGPPSARHRPRATEPYLDRDFLRKELELVLFGLEALDFGRYTDPSQTPRIGRKMPLTRGQRVRVWRELEAEYKSDSGSVPFIRRRVEVYLYNERRLAAGEQLHLCDDYRGLTHVFVDEAQDMTRADLKLLAHTPPSPKRLFIAGDSAQALHTGGTSPRPRISGTTWQNLALSGSYRLPSLVCTALTPLAEHIIESQPAAGDPSGPQGTIPEVRRSAVPGPRPVVVDGADTDEMVRAMRTMGSFAGRANGTWNVVYQRGSPERICEVLEGADVPFNKISMLKKKGLEFPLVLLPTNAMPPDEETSPEWLYTALTRATSVVMLAACPPTNESVGRALALLDSEHLMFWDDHARSAWDRLVAAARRVSIHQRVSGSGADVARL